MNEEKTCRARELRNQGLSYRTIGNIIDVPEETVRRHLNLSVGQYNHRYYQIHKAEICQGKVGYYAVHKTHIENYKSGYYQDHRVGTLRRVKEYTRTHRGQYNAYNAQRRVLKAGALIGATLEQLAEIKEIYRCAKEDPKVRCYLCGDLIPIGHRHVDHIYPVSKGGPGRPSNLAVACDECNMRKHDKLPSEVGILL